MRAAKLWAPVIIMLVTVTVGQWLASPDPSATFYWNWLMAGGAASGIVTGVWAGRLSRVLCESFLAAVAAGLVLGAALMIPQLLIYGLLLPDALTVPPGGVPQDNFTPWLLAGICGLPLAAVTGAVTARAFWRGGQR